MMMHHVFYTNDLPAACKVPEGYTCENTVAGSSTTCSNAKCAAGYKAAASGVTVKGCPTGTWRLSGCTRRFRQCLLGLRRDR